MRIHCLGTTGYHPSPSRHTACYYIPEIDLLLDAGTGLFRLIPVLTSAPRSELNILLSHAHLDHIVGLTFLLDVMSLTQLRRIRIFGMPEKLEAVRSHLFHSSLFPVGPEYEFVDLPNGEDRLRIGNADIDYFPLDHPGGSIGMVIHSNGKKIAYMTDTTPRIHQELLGRLKDLDLLMHECYFEDDQTELALRTGHSWLDAVASLVDLVRPKQTLLIHVNPVAELLGYSFKLESHHEKLNMMWASDGLILPVC